MSTWIFNIFFPLFHLSRAPQNLAIIFLSFNLSLSHAQEKKKSTQLHTLQLCIISQICALHFVACSHAPSYKTTKSILHLMLSFSFKELGLDFMGLATTMNWAAAVSVLGLLLLGLVISTYALEFKRSPNISFIYFSSFVACCKYYHH